MYLKALEIQGFKSFPDRTRVTFEGGITAVVGPNGSGKSNIADAIRWVMGETSAKQLRGGGKMENVIFGGTKKRGAMGYASVQLVLDNTSRRLDIEANEVSIGRKYYRSGESEYSINGQSVRLKDVYELLLDTGLGRDGYSIIGQGRIAEIVASKSGERREIFEEASGIARFRYRKNEAERRLAHAEENLLRLRDILGELEVRVGPLEKESAKAQKFVALSQERKSLEVTLWVDTVHTTREALREQQRKIEIAQAEYAAKAREIDTIDHETAGIRTEIENLIIETDRSNAEIRRLQAEISGQDSQVAVLRNDIAHNTANVQVHKEEIRQTGESAGAIENEIALHHAAIELASRKLAEAEASITLLEQEIQQIQQKSLATGERRGEITAQLAQATNRVTALQVSEAAANSQMQAAAARLTELTQTADTTAQEVAALQEQQADTKVLLAHVEQELTKLSNITGGLEMKLAARNEALKKADENERALTRSAENAEHRLRMLQDLENNLDGFQGSVKAVVKAGREGRLRGIIGPVSTILSVKPGYEVAIETALGYALQNIVVEDETAAKAAMAMLKSSNAGRATFLPLNTVKPQRLDAARLPVGAVSAQTLVQYNPRFENIVSSLLARIVVVEDINEASHTARALDYRNRVVTQDGQIINAGGSFTGGSVSRSAGLFSRKQEMEELRSKLKAYQAQLGQAQAHTDAVKAEVDALQAELTATQSESITYGNDKIRTEGELTRLQQAMQSAQLTQQRLAAETQEQHAAHTQAAATLATAKAEQQTLKNTIEQASAELSTIAGEDDSFLANREQITQQLSELRLAHLGHQNDMALHRQNIETLQSRTGEGQARRAMLQANIEALLAQNAEYEEKIKSLARTAQDAKIKIEEIEVSIKEKAARRLAKEASITGQTSRERSITAAREELGREIARLTEQKATLETRYDSTISQLWEEYELSLSDAEGLCVAFTSVADLRRRVTELRNKIRSLGNVNVGAIEEFAEVNERYTFLKKQVQDVEASKTSLEKMITELSGEMTTMFTESFAQINRHFGRIFNELFGGGNAELTLSEPDNVLESGIDINVSPPGKIIKDLAALSGGEQSLVAICIYFAILAVNPAPFCVLDEIEAALDDVNVLRYAQYLRRITRQTQFITITHRRGTMEEADVLYGVTMQEDGVSKLLRLNVSEVDAALVR